MIYSGVGSLTPALSIPLTMERTVTLKQPPELTDIHVQIIEELRNHPERTKQACASMMDTRLEWHIWNALDAARADGFDPAETLCALIDLMGGSVYAHIQRERHEDAKSVLKLLATLELQHVMKRL